MPQTEVVFFKESDGAEPFREWFDTQSPIVQAKCFRALKNLEDFGFELRRPVADFLRDGIYELRFRHLKVNYRILYFFSGRQVVVVSHGLTKQGPIPSVEIDKAIKRKALFERDAAGLC
jgi:phage-related protein